jgi:hypothetical protein
MTLLPRKVRRDLIIRLLSPIQNLVPFNIYKPKLLSYILSLCLSNPSIQISQKSPNNEQQQPLFASGKRVPPTKTPSEGRKLSLDQEKQQILAAILTHQEEFDRVSALIVTSLAFILSFKLLNSDTLLNFFKNEAKIAFLRMKDSSLTDQQISDILKVKDNDELFYFMRSKCPISRELFKTTLRNVHPDKNSVNSKETANLITRLLNSKREDCKKQSTTNSDESDESDKSKKSNESD